VTHRRLTQQQQGGVREVGGGRPRQAEKRTGSKAGQLVQQGHSGRWQKQAQAEGRLQVGSSEYGLQIEWVKQSCRSCKWLCQFCGG
jgi:hypothetical protein